MADSFVWKELAGGEDYPISAHLLAVLPLTQTRGYAIWQKGAKREAQRFVLLKGNTVVLCLEYVVFPIAFGKRYLYAPYGPVFFEISEAIVAELYRYCQECVRFERGIFFRIDPTILHPHEHTRGLFGNYFKSAPSATYGTSSLQPRAEWYLNLLKSEEELFADMHQKTRYSIRLAEKKGVQVEIIDTAISARFDDFYSLMKETATRNKFSLHEEAYYREAFLQSETSKSGVLTISTYEKIVLTIDFHVRVGNTLHFVFGGSSDAYRNFSPSYLAKWRSIQYAKEHGVTEYNFGGVSVDGERSGWEGLSSFKIRFAGRAVRHDDLYDCIGNLFLYYAYILKKIVT